MRRFLLSAWFLFAAGLAIAEPVIISSGSGPGTLSGGGSGFGATTPFAATGAPTGRSLSDRAADTINIKDGYGTAPGARGATQVTGPVTCAVGSPNVTVSNASFTPADVGKLIYVSDCAAGPITLISTIVSVTDATHVILANNASAAFTNGNKLVVYGYDDAAAISAIMQQVRAKHVNSSFGAYSMSVYFPEGAYIISAVPADLTGQRQLDIDAWGVTFYCATNGAPCLDAYGFYNGRMRGFSMIGDSARPPSYGVQIGRYQDSGAFGLNQFHNLYLTGSYTRAVWYNSASETSVFYGGTFENNIPNTTVFVADGSSSHTLWPAPSTYVTVDTVDGQEYSNSQNTFIGTRFRNAAAGSVGMWFTNAKAWDCINCYWVTKKYGVELYSVGGVGGAQGPFIFQGPFDGQPEYYIFVTRDASQRIMGLDVQTHASVASGTTVFGTTDLASAVTVHGGKFQYDELASPDGKLFDRVEDWAWYGDITGVFVRNATPVLPSTFVGTFQETGQKTITYGVVSAAASVANLTGATGAITQNPGATWIQFEGWGAGGPGGSGIACAAGISCSGGSGGGGGGHFVQTARMLWSDLGVTSCTYAIGQSIAGGAGGVGGQTSVTCGSIIWRANGGGAGGPGTVAAIAAGGGGGSTVSSGGAASGATPGTGGLAGAGAGGAATGVAGASGQAGGGGGSSAVGAGSGGGPTAHGSSGGGGGGGCNAGVAGSGAAGGSNEIGFPAGGIPGVAGRSSNGSSGTGGGGGDGHATAAGVGGAGGTPGGGGGGGGSGCNGTGALGVGGASGGGMIVVWQGN